MIACTILSVTFFKSAGVSAKYTPLVVAVSVPPLIAIFVKSVFALLLLITSAP